MKCNVIIITVIIVPDSNIMYGSNSKVTVTNTNKSKLTTYYVHITAKVCNSSHIHYLRNILLLFQNNYQHDDTYGLSFISGVVVIHSTCFELSEGSSSGVHFFTIQAASGILCTVTCKVFGYFWNVVWLLQFYKLFIKNLISSVVKSCSIKYGIQFVF